MSTETTNKKIKIDNGTTFGKTYTDKAVDERLQGLVSTATFTPVKEKADNSLQKPKGLTKTELVGVGTNGQENIEIGDNLTLANGKLSASGGGSESSKFNFIYLDKDLNITGDYDKSRINICVGGEPDFNSFIFGTILTTTSNNKVISADMTGFLCLFGAMMFTSLELDFQTHKATIKDFTQIGKLSSHFISLTNSTATFYFVYISTSSRKLNTLDSLKTALTGKCLLCTGHTDTEKAEYISGEGANIVVGVVDNSDHSTSGITIDSSFTITDLVSPVE